MNIMNYISPELLVLIPVCWGIGLVLKSSPINNKYIPAILALCSVALACAYVLGTANITGWQAALLAAFTAVTQGLIAWGVAWASYEKGIKLMGVATEGQGGSDEDD